MKKALLGSIIIILLIFSSSPSIDEVTWVKEIGYAFYNGRILTHGESFNFREEIKFPGNYSEISPGVYNITLSVNIYPTTSLQPIASGKINVIWEFDKYAFVNATNSSYEIILLFDNNRLEKAINEIVNLIEGLGLKVDSIKKVAVYVSGYRYEGTEITASGGNATFKIVLGDYIGIVIDISYYNTTENSGFGLKLGYTSYRQPLLANPYLKLFITLTIITIAILAIYGLIRSRSRR